LGILVIQTTVMAEMGGRTTACVTSFFHLVTICSARGVCSYSLALSAEISINILYTEYSHYYLWHSFSRKKYAVLLYFIRSFPTNEGR